MAFDIEKSLTTRYNLPNSFANRYLVSINDIYILNEKDEEVGVLIDEYLDLETAYLELKDKYKEYENRLIELGEVERQYTKEELEELQKEQDRKTLLETQKNVEDLTNLVAQLIEINKKDKELIQQLASGDKEKDLKSSNSPPKNMNNNHNGNSYKNNTNKEEK